MPDVRGAIARVRNCVAAILKVHPTGSKDASGNPVYTAGVVGSAFCVVKNKTFVTAHHVFNDGKPRDGLDKFSIVVCPDNGPAIWHFPFTKFIYEDSANDISIFDAEIPLGSSVIVDQLDVNAEAFVDGTEVLTYGFPAPFVGMWNADVAGNWLGGNILLHGHANTGIVSGSGLDGAARVYEFNVGWHNGESGGPISAIDPVSVFALMQANRTVPTPTGVMRGPRVGKALTVVQAQLQAAGATFV